MNESAKMDIDYTMSACLTFLTPDKNKGALTNKETKIDGRRI